MSRNRAMDDLRRCLATGMSQCIHRNNDGSVCDLCQVVLAVGKGLVELPDDIAIDTFVLGLLTVALGLGQSDDPSLLGAMRTLRVFQILLRTMYGVDLQFVEVGFVPPESQGETVH